MNMDMNVNMNSSPFCPAGLFEEPRLMTVAAALRDGGFQAFAVGGAVRDSLLGAQIHDIDIATDARPDQVERVMAARGVRTEPTGIDHGTITAICDGASFEITTFRHDVSTDGRRATVRFATTIDQDAQRRDFTVNALYCDLSQDLSQDLRQDPCARRRVASSGVIDPTGHGLEDIARRRVRFVGDPHTRIREDALRMLRLFRFSARMASASDITLTEDFAAAAALAPLADHLSRERVGAEICALLKIADSAAVATAISAMAQSGLLERVLPGADAGGMAATCAAEIKAASCMKTPYSPSSSDTLSLRLAALCAVIQPEDLYRLLRLPKALIKTVCLIQKAAGVAPGSLFGVGGLGAAEIGYRLGAANGASAALLMASREGCTADLCSVEKGATRRFPVCGGDVVAATGASGPAVGAILRRLEAHFIASGFSLDRDKLLQMLPQKQTQKQKQTQASAVDKFV